MRLTLLQILSKRCAVADSLFHSFIERKRISDGRITIIKKAVELAPRRKTAY
jgi:hypothetical protein